MKKQKPRKPVGFIILAALLFLTEIVLLELGKNTLWGWALAVLLFAGVIVLALRVLKERGFLLRLGALVAFAMLLGGVFAVSQPPIKQRPAVDYKNPAVTETVHITQGDLTGVYTEDKSVEVYAGIPYAMPPVGELRWKEPQAPHGWEGVRACDTFAPMSLQPRSSEIYNTLQDAIGFGRFHITPKDNYREAMSEDSLYLNIWKPAGEVKDAAVLVFIHGGSLTTGRTSFGDYNGETLAKKGIIVVNFAYRLNVFGYYADEALAAESANGTTGNYGLLDQVQALKWVQENIASFGGNPDKVTIAGESAGASSVNALCVSPLAKGLFRYAIAESSGIVAKTPYHTFRTLTDALATGKEIQQEMGAADLAALRNVDAETLVNTQFRNDSMTVDGYAITEQPYLTYEKGENNEQALLNGFNKHEADLFNLFEKVTKENYVEVLKNPLGDYAEEGAALYPPEKYPLEYDYIVEQGGDAKGAANAVLSAAWFSYSHRVWSDYMTAQNKPVYLYYFTKDNKGLRANHAGELPYAYGNLFREAQLYNESDEALSATMTDYWANFVKTGNPNGDALPTWQPYADDTAKVLELGDKVAMTDAPFLDLYPLIDKYQNK